MNLKSCSALNNVLSFLRNSQNYYTTDFRKVNENSEPHFLLLQKETNDSINLIERVLRSFLIEQCLIQYRISINVYYYCYCPCNCHSTFYFFEKANL